MDFIGLIAQKKHATQQLSKLQTNLDTLKENAAGTGKRKSSADNEAAMKVIEADMEDYDNALSRIEECLTISIKPVKAPKA